MAKGQSIKASISVQDSTQILKPESGWKHVSTAHIKWDDSTAGRIYTGTVVGIAKFEFQSLNNPADIRDSKAQSSANKYSMELDNGDIVGCVFGAVWDSYLEAQGMQLGAVIRFVYKGKVKTAKGFMRHDFEFQFKTD